MTESTLHKPADGSRNGAHHLCVLVHGLWGNGSHLNYLATSLREKHSEDELILLVCKRNASSFTYDGIEVGAERVTKEIEETIEELKRDGYKIDRFSIVGYSLGGLVARYTVGLLDSKGYFDYITPVNFTTFASPHLGVRTPLRGYQNQVWNVLGARTLSASGRQLFTVDNFRNTGRPLLSVLADPESIFIHALAKFENRALYTNIVNDRTAVYYTTGISKKDPYVDLEKLELNYLPGYQDVILDPDHPYRLAQPKQLPTFAERVTGTSRTILKRTPVVAGLVIFIPIAVVAFLINSGIQTLRSQKRILLHEQDNAEGGYERYRISWMVQDMRAGIEDAFEATNAAQQQEYLPEGSEELADGEATSPMAVDGETKLEKDPSAALRRQSTASVSPPDFPTLALTPAQFTMIKALDDVGFKKFRVHIHNSTHSHAALIVRSNRKAFDEGKIVVKHWLDQAFSI
ncbi:hypothetical protein PMZ80_003544 [Knufia obscura]|uniref:DUF676 domain-containing protein n=2 Tax=Knufia TaxID=430999 RepID=A0AAN8FH50_9EURO|nr:hypothetical protein PMZ80_003544 [Knufia obscura]KAK5958541.1 hypothetical protein OHC33_000384 [Knufia fluminis]